MLNILSILTFILNGITNGDTRFIIIDDRHVMDSTTGVKYHLYDSYVKVTFDDKVIAESGYFTQEEQKMLWGIKEAITDPTVLKKNKDEYEQVVYDGRKTLSELYMKPNPPADLLPKPEPDTTVYEG